MRGEGAELHSLRMGGRWLQDWTPFSSVGPVKQGGCKACSFCGSYGFDRLQSPYDLARKAGQLFHTGEGSLRKLLADNGATVLEPDAAGVCPLAWRKPGYIRAGHPGYRGPYATGSNPYSIPVWWGDADRSTPQQDKRYRKR